MVVGLCTEIRFPEHLVKIRQAGISQYVFLQKFKVKVIVKVKVKVKVNIKVIVIVP